MNLQRIITSNSLNDQDSPANDGGVDDDYDEYNDDDNWQRLSIVLLFYKNYLLPSILNDTLIYKQS